MTGVEVVAQVAAGVCLARLGFVVWRCLRPAPDVVSDQVDRLDGEDRATSPEPVENFEWDDVPMDGEPSVGRR